MLLSIIVPVYNVKDYLIKCLDSIHQQIFQDYEVIVVDDGSTDGSGELAEEFCADKEKFHVYHKENGGLMSAWMEGITHAIGQYLGFVDSDDYIHEDMYSHLMDCALKHDCDIVMCDRFDIVGDIIRTGSACIHPGFYQGDQMEEIRQKTLPTFGGAHITNARWNKIFRRELFMDNTRYCDHRSRICEDRFITPACMFSAASFFYLNEPLYYYVFRSGSNHRKASEKLQDTMELLCATQKQMLRDKGLYEKYGELVDRANLNYLRLMIQRNFSGQGDTKQRIKLAKRILSSKDYNSCVQRFQQDLTGKMGIAIKILFRIKSPFPFVFLTRFLNNN